MEVVAFDFERDPDLHSTIEMSKARKFGERPLESRKISYHILFSTKSGLMSQY
jgi:hypothetical protein